MYVASYVAPALNGAIALVAGAASGRSTAPPVATAASEPVPVFRPVYVVIALSGLCALGAEVVWTRLLSLMLGATVYAFSIILAVFLAGLGVGSSAGSVLARRSGNARVMLGMCQFLLAGAAAWAAYT